MKLFAKSYTKCPECKLVFSSEFKTNDKDADEFAAKRKALIKIPCPKCGNEYTISYHKAHTPDSVIYNIYELMDSKDIICDIDEHDGTISCYSDKNIKDVANFAICAADTLIDVFASFVQFVQLDENYHLKISVKRDYESYDATNDTLEFLNKWYQEITNSKFSKRCNIDCNADLIPDAQMLNALTRNPIVTNIKLDLKSDLIFKCDINEKYAHETHVRYIAKKYHKVKEYPFTIRTVYKDGGINEYTFEYSLGPTEIINEKSIDIFLAHMIAIVAHI